MTTMLIACLSTTSTMLLCISVLGVSPQARLIMYTATATISRRKPFCTIWMNRLERRS